MTTAQHRTRGDEADLYRRHHRDLQRAVARAVNAPRELIEDACQSAWTIMLRSQPDRAAIFAWLRVVAIHEAYRLCAAERCAHLEDLASQGWDAVIADRVTIDDTSKPAAHCEPSPSSPTASARTSPSASPASATARSPRSPAGDLHQRQQTPRKARARIRLAELP